MNHKLLSLLLLACTVCLSTACCEKRKQKLNRYQIAVGQSIEIPYRTDPCCYYCWANAYEAKSVRFIEKKESPQGDAAFVFKGYEPGVDTIKLRMVHATATCDSSERRAEVHVVVVK